MEKRSQSQRLLAAGKKLLQVLKKFLRVLCSIFFIFAGTMHFTKTDLYESIMPDYLPFPVFLVYLSGVCEITGGVGLMIPRFRRLASWGLIALLIAVFPANLNMAVNGIDLGLPHAVLWWRLPFQLVFMVWVYWCGKD
jgi:uncharacterized membrane protein